MLSCIYADTLLANLQACWHDMSAYCTSMLDWFYARMPCVRMLAGCYVNMQACVDSCMLLSIDGSMHAYIPALMLSCMHAFIRAWLYECLVQFTDATWMISYLHLCASLHACMILCVDALCMHLPTCAYACPIKGTVSRDFSCPVFFIKQLLLVPIGKPRNDFEFFRIFVELFVFVIDSSAMNTPGSRL